jgi:hypothetical protein
MTIEILTAFFGWCSVINMGVLLVSSLMIAISAKTFARFHAKMFGLEEAAVSLAYFRYLANYKIMTIGFCIVPYFALNLVAR